MNIVDEDSDSEIIRIALHVVHVLLAQWKSLLIRNGDRFAAIPKAFQGCMHHAFVLPCEAAKKDGRVIALPFREGPLDGFVEMVNFALLDSRFLLQAPALFLQALANCRLRG